MIRFGLIGAAALSLALIAPSMAGDILPTNAHRAKVRTVPPRPIYNYFGEPNLPIQNALRWGYSQGYSITHLASAASMAMAVTPATPFPIRTIPVGGEFCAACSLGAIGQSLNAKALSPGTAVRPAPARLNSEQSMKKSPGQSRGSSSWEYQKNQ